MISISDFMGLCMLAEAEDFFKMIGPLLIFGIYIVGSLAKGWTKERQQESEEEPSELRKAVQRRYKEIHQRQVGAGQGQPQPPRRTEPASKTVHVSRPVEPPRPVRQPSQKAFPFQTQRIPPSVQMKKRSSRKTHQQPAKVRAQDIKSFQKVRAPRPTLPKSTVAEPAGSSLASLLRRPQDLRTAVILKEILDRPLALRDI